MLNCNHPSVWKYFDAVIKDMAIQKKILIDENSGQPGQKKRKYVQLNNQVQDVVSKYETYTNKLKFLRCIGMLQSTN